jgi:hypothetical protein
VRRAPHERQAVDTMRPRGVSGVFRSRAPLALQLRLAAQQDRLLWWSPQLFALLEPPGNQPARGGSRWVRWLDRWWDLLLFAIPPVVLLAAAALLALPAGAVRWRQIAAVACALLASGYVATLMTAVAVRGFLSLYRTLILGRSTEVTQSGIGQVLASHWSMPLCQLLGQDTEIVAGMVLDAVQARVADRVAVSPQAATPADVLCLEHGVTSTTGRAALRRDPRVAVFTPPPPVWIIRLDLTGRLPRPAADLPRRAVLAAQPALRRRPGRARRANPLCAVGGAARDPDERHRGGGVITSLVQQAVVLTRRRRRSPT